MSVGSAEELWRILLALGTASCVVLKQQKKEKFAYIKTYTFVYLNIFPTHKIRLVGIILLSFFVSSSQLTKIKNKGVHEARNWKQVLCNSLPATIYAVFYYQIVGTQYALPFLRSHGGSTFYLGAFVSFFAAACAKRCKAHNNCPLSLLLLTTGDTWSSEIGGMAKSQPRLIIQPTRIVPAGTNGGVTLAGLAAATAAGLFIGCTFWLSTVSPADEWLLQNAGNYKWDISNYPSLYIIPILAFCGLIGSLIDSVLGALFQFSGWDFNASAVVNVMLIQKGKVSFRTQKKAKECV
ncbi:hypothetical protein RFI_02332 [Reticulomyxa filosa]|uniref:Transmembrane protein 19 n=1 Tax=Reticulomyxa filosa TaxID=46433 RepID=X6P881_RETFI|nr:hypothetical protein RFI_02332 [Reticulomyxa filosa]|eukprot:ETO34755.1 hypothetical protein RFI_02332 [Reticulomyxa filosa]